MIRPKKNSRLRVTRKIFIRGRTQIPFLIDFPEMFSSLVSFTFFVLLFFLLICVFFEIKNIYSDTHSNMRAGE